MLFERKIERIVIHCTGSSPYAPVENILREFKIKGWKNPGYHFLVLRTGEVRQILPLEEVANGAQGYNATAIHVAYIGGWENQEYRDTRTPEQREAIFKTIQALKQQCPSAEVLGHCELNKNKGCPLFNVKKEYAQWLQSSSCK